MTKLNIEKDVLTIDDDDSFISKLIKGCKGKVILKARGQRREIKTIKDYEGNVIKERKEK